jgi:hypothetical protein
MSELTEMGTTTGGVPEWWVVKEIKRCWRGCCPRFCCALRWQVRGGLQFLARLGENIRQAIIERVPTQNRGSEIPAEGPPHILLFPWSTRPNPANKSQKMSRAALVNIWL